MSTTYTPGPWEVRRDSEALSSGARITDHFTIVKVKGGIGGGDAIVARLRCEANARLIAAAPELLAALKSCLPCLDGRADDAGIVSQVVAAIEDVRAWDALDPRDRAMMFACYAPRAV
jgi:hypothetical protein